MNWLNITIYGVFVMGGIHGLLMVYGVVKPKPGENEKMEIWHQKFDRTMKILCPLLIVGGLILIIVEVFFWPAAASH